MFEGKGNLSPAWSRQIGFLNGKEQRMNVNTSAHAKLKWVLDNKINGTYRNVIARKGTAIISNENIQAERTEKHFSLPFPHLKTLLMPAGKRLFIWRRIKQTAMAGFQ